MLLSMYLHVLYNHLFMATFAQTNAGLEPSVNYGKKSVQPTSEHVFQSTISCQGENLHG